MGEKHKEQKAADAPSDGAVRASDDAEPAESDEQLSDEELEGVSGGKAARKVELRNQPFTPH